MWPVVYERHQPFPGRKGLLSSEAIDLRLLAKRTTGERSIPTRRIDWWTTATRTGCLQEARSVRIRIETTPTLRVPPIRSIVAVRSIQIKKSFDKLILCHAWRRADH